MLGFLFGVVVGAAGFWAYRFWKGDQDTSWDQSYSTGGTGTQRYDSYGPEPVGSSAATGAVGTEGESATPSGAP
jgi:hypothetical protein